ncbi:M23 family metallopeptidase [Polaribacter sp. R77954]|uniref:M23 family metallopeptidase n=1 Tax=Polaribacter sp. R77954 TaxID=3093870 RepID=UPI0037C5253B
MKYKNIWFLIFFLFSNILSSQDKSFEAYKREQERNFEAYKKEYYVGLDSINKEFNEYLKDENERFSAYKNLGVIPEIVKKRVANVEKLYPKGLAKIPLKQSKAELIEINKVWKKQLKNIKENKKIKKKDLVIKIKPSPKNKVPIKKPNKIEGKKDQIVLKDSENKKELELELAANRPVFCPLPNKAYRISSKFKMKRKHPILKKVRKHEGIDLAAPKGTKVYASANGKVTISKFSKSAGNFIILNHNNGYTTTFMHLNKRYVKLGDKIKRGELIGEVGSTGYSSGNHLHYEIRKNGDAFNPADFIIKHF